MNKRLIIGFLFGMLVSSIAFAVSNASYKSFTLNNNVKVDIQQVSKETASGRIMVKIDGKWYRFQNQVYPLKVK